MAEEKVTPLMQQYFDIKQQHPDTLLFFQVGDFYELFFEDAQQASAFLAITLTKRGKNKGLDIPLCGIPIHALNHYLRKLIKGGFKVAICDQLSKPIPGTVVQRGVTQVFTPGTLTDSLMLDDKSASYLLSLYPNKDTWSLVFTELLTAQIFATTVPAENYRMVEAELIRFFPDEIILPDTKNIKQLSLYFKQLGYCTSLTKTEQPQADDKSEHAQQWIETQFSPTTTQQITSNESMLRSFDLLFNYLKKNQERALAQFKSIQFYQPEDYLVLDASTQKNLEIVKNNQDGSRKYSLFGVIDHAKTAMGSRTLKKWLLRPLVQKDTIAQRLATVDALHQQVDTLQQLEELLSQLADLERIIGRIALKRAILNDYLALKDSLLITPAIKELLQNSLSTSLSKSIQEKLGNFAPLVELLEQSLNDDSSYGHSIKKGFNADLDRLRNLVENGQQGILNLEQREIQRTGISSLKIRFTNISGYYIEVTDTNQHLVPGDYQHQQTLVNRKRFVTPELIALEKDMNRAQNEIEDVEAKVFTEVKFDVEKQLAPLRQIAQALAYLDALFSFAKAAYTYGYVSPVFNDKEVINIKGGRHPVVETTISGSFVKNGTQLDNEQALLIITGPNMGGKSTYLRQVALICIMAQCGSFVPADAANLPLLDRIFTRIGSGDNLAEGKSTFLVEMEETATICTQATKKSLVILDEVGRGTSTFDGIALAQAIIEHILTNIKAKCLFATHYHELTTLSEHFPAIKNYSMQCTKTEQTIHFMHQIKEGVAHGSFGLEVAKLAHIPETIIHRAKHLLGTLENSTRKQSTAVISSDVSLLHEENILLKQKNSILAEKLLTQATMLEALQSIDMNSLSPKQAFDLLWDLKQPRK